MRTDRVALAFSTVALVVALTIGGAYAKQFLLTGKDIRNNTITTKDLRNNTIADADIGANQVAPSDLELPPPVEATPPEASGPVSGEFTKLATVGTYQKEQAESQLSIAWSGAIMSGPGTNCSFQVRVDGAPPSAGGGEVFNDSGPSDISTTALFAGLPIGPVTVEVWARERAAVTPTPTCIIGPANPGIESTFVITEEVQ